MEQQKAAEEKKRKEEERREQLELQELKAKSDEEFAESQQLIDYFEQEARKQHDQERKGDNGY